MPDARIEHVNFTVADTARTARMLDYLFGWQVRWQGRNATGGYTIHVGSERDYLAVHTPLAPAGPITGLPKGRPLNHIGIVVDDLDVVERRVGELGLIPFGHDDYDPGRRFYFFDADGIEFEIVSYA